MRENLAEYGLTLDDVPIVIQVNKRDLPDALPVEMVRAVVDPEGKFPVLEAVATEGKGVFETLKEVSRLVLARVAGGS